MKLLLLAGLWLVSGLVCAAQPAGTWKLTSITSDGQTIRCPGQVTLPPGAPAITQSLARCSEQEMLHLYTNGRFTTNLTVLSSMKSMSGSWFSKSITRVGHYITFVDPLLPERPRAYAWSLKNHQRQLTVSQSMTIFDPSIGAMRTSQSELLFERSQH